MAMQVTNNRQTLQAVDGPRVRQFSVFLKNKVGALLEVVRMLNQHRVDVVGLSVQDSTDSSIVRLVVSDPDAVEQLFKEHDIAFGVCEMVVAELDEVSTDLCRILASLLAAEVNIFFSYPLLTRPNGRAVLALHVEDHECAASVLGGDGFKLLSQLDISR
jgi:hypothetical protein